ncbi:hypothetical protein [Verminephrobacter eiseniae]|uniref:hypothetical protein n=1 Tax=Verminephrobacter eiseniae TaxID=364317 RepID=UPI0000DC92A9|nr:hypothetical protein [Verminephrobacter eiseniae]
MSVGSGIAQISQESAACSTNPGRFGGPQRAKNPAFMRVAENLQGRLNTVMRAYDLMSLLRQALFKTSTVKHTSNTVRHTLQTLRYKSFAKPAYITTESRKSILHLAMAMQRCAWMQGWWDTAQTFDLPARFSPVSLP